MKMVGKGRARFWIMFGSICISEMYQRVQFEKQEGELESDEEAVQCEIVRTIFELREDELEE